MIHYANQKYEKLRRYYGAKFRSAACLPFFWHIGQPNFGDDINPIFFEKISQKRIRLSPNRRRHHYLGIGSILKKATSASTVIGSGFQTKGDSVEQMPVQVISLRGTTSQAMLGYKSDVWLGDPLVLVDRFFPVPVEKKRRFGFIPHVSGYLEAMEKLSPKINIINPSAKPWKVIEQIAACELIMSESLHGLIVSDALKVPNLWIEPGEKIPGGRFKFDDYFTTLDQSKRAFVANSNLIDHPPLEEFSVGLYMHDKDEYIDLITSHLKSDVIL